MTTVYALDYHTQSERTTAPLIRQHVTEAEYWDKYYDAPDVTYEWNNGYLEKKAVSDFATYLMYQWFSELLNHFLRTRQIAKTTGLEIGFRLTLPDTTEIRRPDLGVVLKKNPVPLLLNDRSYKGTFDLCIEAISDSTKKEIERDTVSKKWEYAKGGVKEYYILDGHDRYLEFYRLNTDGVYILIEPTTEGIIQSSVLPGFQFRRKDLFTKPSPDEMVDDPIYQKFVLLGYREAKEQVEAEKRARQKVEEEAEAERRARQKAEAENARLMVLLEKLQKVK